MISVFLEIGSKRTLAGAIDWPGWCRSGGDESSALMRLLDYGPRYARTIQSTQEEFVHPASISDFEVTEKLEGDATTDFGAPGAILSSDEFPLTNAELERSIRLLTACWEAFCSARLAAAGKELSKGPRGGGRELEKIVQHVMESESAYLNKLGWKHKLGSAGEVEPELAKLRESEGNGLAASVRGELPSHGPRGGKYWTSRTYLRRAAWHILDHAWEIEDRIPR